MSSTSDLRAALDAALPDRPFTLRLWDATELPNTNGRAGPTFTVRSPLALGHVLRAPGQLGLGRAYVTGEIEVDDLELALDVLDDYKPGTPQPRELLALARGAVGAGALRRLPRVPSAELRPRGRRHSVLRDLRSVRHHYDVGNEFFRLMLGPSYVYSCAIWSRGATTLEEAQAAKLELVCFKLGLTDGAGAGRRVLDVGCGWGSFAVHAASQHGAHVTGITLSERQAEIARARAAEAGVAELVDIRVMDYRDLGTERFDAISSIGMVEHVGSVNVDAYAELLHRCLEPGGWLLNHGITRLRWGDPEAGPFSERFVFPDAAPLHLSRIQAAVERAGFVTHHVEGFAPDYSRTLRAWAANVDESLEEARRLAGEERLRIWRLYLRAARRGFDSGFLGVYQVRAQRG